MKYLFWILHSGFPCLQTIKSLKNSKKSTRIDISSKGGVASSREAGETNRNWNI